MVFEVLHCTEADMLKCAEMYRDSFNFQEHPLLDALLPNIDTLEGRQSAAARLAAALETPNSHHLKVVDAETGEMLCRGRWVFLPALDEDQARDVAFVMKDEDVVDSDTFGKWMLERYQVTLNNKRRQSEKALWYLSSLTTPPQNAGRGAGSALLKWGMEKADESGIECVLEGALRAETFYQRHGFISRGRVDVAPPESWKHKGSQSFIWMERAAKPVAST